MAPVLARDVIGRDTSTGKTFSVVFAVIALLVVAACILWGYYVPKWRWKYGRPSSTRFNCVGGAAKYGPSTPPRAPRYAPHFPNHPGVRGLYKGSSLPIYNPRTETPFSNSPRNGDIVNLRNLTPTPPPPTQRKKTSTLKRPTHNYELPKTPGTLSQLALTASLRGYSLDGDEELEPESLMVAPVARSAGRAPPLTRQLALFPTPHSSSTRRFDTLAHPNLLFEKLDKLDSRKVPPASDESCFSELTLVPRGKRCGANRRNNPVQGLHDVKSDAEVIGEVMVGIRTSRKQSRSMDSDEPTISRPKPIHKSKPKTPVANIRDRRDRYAGGVTLIPPRNASLQRRLTPSTEPLTTSASAESDFIALTTPPTSPPPTTHNRALVSTPLHLRRAAARAASASPTPAQANGKHVSPSQSSTALSPGKLVPFSLQRSLKSRRDFRKSVEFYHTKSNIKPTVARPKPLHIKRTSWKSSSVYSRDTKAMSILRSPAFAPAINNENGTGTSFDELGPRRANSMDLVRSKIDDWNLHTGDLQLSVSTTLDRPQSDVGHPSPPLQVDAGHPVPLASHLPEDASTAFGLTMPIPEICVGRPSDDVFSDGESVPSSGLVLRRVLDMEIASTRPTIFKYCGRTAPGGAEWI